MKKTIIIIRHGETNYNLNKKILGQNDVQLNARGIIESYWAISQLFKNITQNHQNLLDYKVISSPLKRAKFQADLLNIAFSKKYLTDTDLMERNWGDYTSDFKSYHKGELLNTPPNGESYTDFKSRIANFLKRHINENDHLILFTHMGVIREIFSIYNLDKDSVKNGAILKLEIDSKGQCKEVHLNTTEISECLFQNRLSPFNINKDVYNYPNIIDYLKNKHKNQKRANGADYYLHLLRVYSILRHVKIQDDNILLGALLHDIIEDTDDTFTNLTNRFNDEVANIVQILSLKKGIPYKNQEKEYIKNILDYGDKAILVKLADQIDNLTDIEGISEIRQQKMAKKAFYILNRTLNKINFTEPNSEALNILTSNLIFVTLNRICNKELITHE